MMIWVNIHAEMLKRLDKKYEEEILDAAYECGEIVCGELRKLSLLELLRIKYGKE